MQPDNSSNEIVSVLRGRAAFYEFFYEAYKGVATEEFLGVVKTFLPHFQAMADEMELADIKTGASLLTEFVNNDMAGDIPALLTKMNQDYTGMFLLGHSSLPSSGSVYLSPEKLMKQDSWEDVIRYFKMYGFGMPADFKDVEDHVAAEMLFMCFLAENSARALEDGKEEHVENLLNTQGGFFAKHVLSWVPALCDGVAARSTTSTKFYQAVSLLLKGYLKYEDDFFKEVAE